MEKIRHRNPDTCLSATFSLDFVGKKRIKKRYKNPSEYFIQKLNKIIGILDFSLKDVCFEW